MRVLAILATIGAILASSTANAEWAVTRYVDPITDELNFSATVMGKSRSVFFYQCIEHAGAVYLSAGFDRTDAGLSRSKQNVRIRFDQGQIEEKVFVVRDNLILVDGDEALNLFDRANSAKVIAYDFTDGNGNRIVDSFLTTSTDENLISMLTGHAECLKRIKGSK